MSERFEYLSKPLADWTEQELRHAHENSSVLREGLPEAVAARLDAIAANKRLIYERHRNQAEKRRLLLSFTDMSCKPARSIDARSVKHAGIDATTQKGGGPALTIAGAAAAYDWLSGHPELKDVLLAIPTPIFLIFVLGGAGWWLLLFTNRLSEKWAQSH